MGANKIKVAVCGGAGFIGSCLADRLVEFNPIYEVTIIDNLSTGKLSNVRAKHKFVKCDVNNYDDISAVFLSNRFDYVFMYNAVVGVSRTQNNPISVLNDIRGFENVLSLCKNTGVKHIYFSSSSEVYGESVHYPQNESDTPLNSRLPYAIVKNVGEAFLKSYRKEHGLNYTIFRFFNTYGARQSTDFVISKFIRAAIDNQDITIFGDGSQTRTFCHVDDNVEACVLAFEKKQFVNDVVNIGGNEEITILELAKLIIRITGSKSKIVNVAPLKEGDMSRRLPDNSKMLNLLQRKLITLEDGLKKMINDGSFFLTQNKYLVSK